MLKIYKKSVILSVIKGSQETIMVIAENEKLEKSVLAGVSCIAVPVEAFVTANGDNVITSYSFCIDKAIEWESRYGDDLLAEESVDWMKKEFSSVAEKIGYSYFESENEYMLEYIFVPGMQLPKMPEGIKIHKISSNAVLAELCRNSGCDIEIADDGEDVLFAVVENGIILAYAGMNDIVYDDNSVEISVETAPDCRRRGYGYACVAALTTYLIEKGITVRYKCSKENYKSSALCEKCNFKLEGRRFSFVCEKI